MQIYLLTSWFHWKYSVRATLFRALVLNLTSRCFGLHNHTLIITIIIFHHHNIPPNYPCVSPPVECFQKLLSLTNPLHFSLAFPTALCKLGSSKILLPPIHVAQVPVTHHPLLTYFDFWINNDLDLKFPSLSSNPFLPFLKSVISSQSLTLWDIGTPLILATWASARLNILPWENVLKPFEK